LRHSSIREFERVRGLLFESVPFGVLSVYMSRPTVAPLPSEKTIEVTHSSGPFSICDRFSFVSPLQRGWFAPRRRGSREHQVKDNDPLIASEREKLLDGAKSELMAAIFENSTANDGLVVTEMTFDQLGTCEAATKIQEQVVPGALNHSQQPSSLPRDSLFTTSRGPHFDAHLLPMDASCVI
jgi:hypothetical protein